LRINELQELSGLKKNAIDFILNNISKKFVLISKWGGDGSSGHSEYKERSWEDVSDNNVIITSVVPLQSCSTKTSAGKFIFGKFLGFRGVTVVPSGYSLRKKQLS
jgi:hypothetical protein